MKFKTGDKVKSAPDSSDVVSMKATWIAVIHKVVAENNDGGCYETLGVWKPLVYKNGNTDDFWKDITPTEQPTIRQLYGSHLVGVEE